MPEAHRYSRRDLWRWLLGRETPASSRLTPNCSRLTPVERVFCQRPPGAAIPQVDLNHWTLLVDGLVARPLVLSYDDLLASPSEVAFRTIVGPDGLLATAAWLGWRLANLLARAGVPPEATHALFLAADNARAHLPLAILDEAFLAYRMDGEPLRPEHGFPLRILVPGRVEASAFGWLKHIRLVAGASRGEEAPEIAGAHLRIDTPSPHTRVRIGEAVAIQGVAFAGTRRITAVAISIDGGDWMPAALRPPDSPHVWTVWHAVWTPQAPGDHRIGVRATAEDGFVPSRRVETGPGGHAVSSHVVISVL